MITTKKKRLLFTLVFALGGTSAMVISLAKTANDDYAYLRADKESEYVLTLDNTNKVTTASTSAFDHTVKTKAGNDVTLTYCKTSVSSTGHVNLSSGGYIVNKNAITSMEGLTVDYSGSGTLKFKLSYDGETWSEQTTVQSGYKFDFESDPYFVRFDVYNSSVNISSIKIEYSCADTIDEHRHEYQTTDSSYYEKVTSTSDFGAGKYLIVYEVSSTSAKALNGAASSIDSTGNYVSATIVTENDTYKINSTDALDSAAFTVAAVSGGYSFKRSNNSYILHNVNSGSNSLNTSNSAQANSVEINNGVATIISNDYYMRFNKSSNHGDRFRYYSTNTSQQSVCLYKQVVTQAGTHVEYDIPELGNYEVGFTASDSKKSYSVENSFNSKNGLVVESIDVNGNKTTISSGYTYVLKDSNNNVINPDSPFGVAGEYTLTVSYKDYTPVEIAISVSEDSSDVSWSIFIYMCGSNLESDYGYATSDINEILSVAGQPEDVNIIIQTGGATKWKTSGIDKSKSCRFEVRDGQLVTAAGGHVAKADMGAASTLQSFLTWGFNNYPAEKNALILWNHGGAMGGVCYDDNYSSDYELSSLMNSEVKSACTAAINSNANVNKLEWIGYDACLMAVQDIAEFNSSFANYMVGAEETELGEGWDYDNWIDDLYAKEDTETILTAICDSFVSSVDWLIENDSDYEGVENDQTLAWFDLSKMSTYKTAWESLASQMNNKSYNKTNFQTFMKGVKAYATSAYTYQDLDDIATENDVSVSYVIQYFGLVQVGDLYYDYGYKSYGIFDAKDFLSKLRSNSTFGSGLSSYIDNVLSAHSNLVGHMAKGSAAGESYGICLFFSLGEDCNKSTNYSSTQTNFTNWRTFVNNYGI